MPETLKLWSFLSATHLGAAALSTALEIDLLSDIIAGTIYLPLWPASKLGLPVFQPNQWMLPPPNLLGWAFIISFWALIYWAIAAGLGHILQRRSRAA
jgi:hypothetical protein